MIDIQLTYLFTVSVVAFFYGLYRLIGDDGGWLGQGSSEFMDWYIRDMYGNETRHTGTPEHFKNRVVPDGGTLLRAESYQAIGESAPEVIVPATGQKVFDYGGSVTINMNGNLGGHMAERISAAVMAGYDAKPICNSGTLDTWTGEFHPDPKPVGITKPCPECGADIEGCEEHMPMPKCEHCGSEHITCPACKAPGQGKVCEFCGSATYAAGGVVKPGQVGLVGESPHNYVHEIKPYILDNKPRLPDEPRKVW